MLSISPIKSSNQAVSYYEADDYYLDNSPDALTANQWWGRGADRLGLGSSVEHRDFKNLLEGYLPTGQQLGRISNGQIHHRPGYDLTFSAPKSVSVLALIGQDERLIEAHDKAVNAALNYLQTYAVQTRSGKQGQVVFEKTDNLIAAKFRHNTSREQDPQLHTHTVVMNATERTDNCWRSLSSEALYDHKMAAGVIYRSVLAYEIQQTLGYQIKKTHDDGRFEIGEVPQALLCAFSKRREQIEKKMAKGNLSSGKAAEQVALKTRARKQKINYETLRAEWMKCALLQGIDVKSIVNTAQIVSQSLQKITSDKLIQRQANHLTRYACEHLAEREAKFERSAILKKALGAGMGEVKLHHIEKALRKFEGKGHLIAVSSDKSQWTTRWALELEKRAIQQMLSEKDQVKAIASKQKVVDYLSQQNLTYEQRKAAEFILTTRDRIVGIQGYAGTGKTTLLASIREFAEQQGYTLRGLAPSAKAAQRLEQSIHIPSITLHRYLNQMDSLLNKNKHQSKLMPSTKEIILLDESSLASTRHLVKLQDLLKAFDSRLVYVGDVSQYGSVEAGRLFAQLQEAGMQTATLQQIQRQKDPELLAAVYHAISGEIQSSFDKLGDRLIIIQDKFQRLQAIAEAYANLSPRSRDQSVLLVPSNRDREVVHSAVRKILKQKRELLGESKTYTTLNNQNLTKAEMKRASNYQMHNVVRFNKTYKSLGLKAGDYAQVKALDERYNSVTLQRPDGTITLWYPHRLGKREGAIEVYKREERQLMVGDKIRWLRNDKVRGLLNADMAKVLAVAEKQIVLSTQDGRTIKLDSQAVSDQHWEYGYALTGYNAQGSDYERTIAHGESFRKHLTHQRNFYVTLSRSKQEFQIYVDDKDRYLAALERNTGEKTSAIEHIKKEFTWENFMSVKDTAIAKDLTGNNVANVQPFLQKEKIQDFEIEM